MRVTKPGGLIYMQAPFAFPLHYGEAYGDFWRFAPNGLMQLFPGARLLECEIWGDDPIMANGYAVLMQKAPFDEDREAITLWLDIPNDDGPRPIVPHAQTEFRWPVYQVTRGFKWIADIVNARRTNMWNEQRVFVPTHLVARELMYLYARRLGTLGFRADRSFIETEPTSAPLSAR
jgi:hypothetical protein